VFVYMFPTLNVMGRGSYLMGHGSHIRWVNGSRVNSIDPLPALEGGPGRNSVDFSGDTCSFVDCGSFSRKQRGRKLTFCSVSQQVRNEF